MNRKESEMMQKSAVNANFLTAIWGAIRGAVKGFRNTEYKNLYQHLANTGKYAAKGAQEGADVVEKRLLGPYLARIIAGTSRQISSNKNMPKFIRDIARRVGTTRSYLAGKYSRYINPSNSTGVLQNGTRTLYQTAQPFIPGADVMGSMLYRTPAAARSRIVNPELFGHVPSPDYTGRMHRATGKLNEIFNMIAPYFPAIF